MGSTPSLWAAGPLEAKPRQENRHAGLLKRGLVAQQTVSCGAYDCVGHQALTMTSVGVMVWNAVKCGS